VTAEEERQVRRRLTHEQRLLQVLRITRHDVAAVQLLHARCDLENHLADSRAQPAAELEKVGNEIPRIGDDGRVLQPLAQPRDVALEAGADGGYHARDPLLVRLDDVHVGDAVPA